MKLKLLFLLTILTAIPTYAGVITGVLQGPSGLPVRNSTLTFKLNQVGLIVGTGAVANTTAQCWTDASGNVVGAPNPLILPNMAANYGVGAVPGGIYYLVYTFLNASGQSAPSPEARIQLTGTGSIVIQPPASIPAGVTGMNIFVGTSSGAETMQGVQGATNVFTLGTPLVSGAAPPAQNTTSCSIAFNDQIIPYTGYSVSLTSSSGNAYPGWPQSWQLNGGAAGTVNVSAGAPLWNGTVIYPMPILSQPLNHGPQSISGNLNMGGYDLDNVGNLNAATSINSTYFPPTIANAVSEAGQSGSVEIPGSYQGTDGFTNPNNIRVRDNRPHNPGNRANYVQLPGSDGTVPQTTIKASEYGAVCNGVTDDTTAIQNAVNAMVTVIGGAGYGVTSMGGATVELPQGRCIISNTITIAGNGSIVGSANGTWLDAIDPWHGTTGDMIAITDVYVPNALPAYYPQGVNRRVQDINFEYNTSAVAHTAVHVFSQYGSAANKPYPSIQSNPQPYQPQFVTISGNTVFAMDTGFQLDDCGQCVVMNNQVSFVRAGFVNNGNDYDVVLTNDFFIGGSFAYTPVSQSGGPDLGIYSVSAARYYCNSGTGANCSGGTLTQVITSPQSLTLEDVEVEGFQRGGFIVNCLAFVMNGSGIDTAGPDWPALYLGQLKFAQIYYSFMDVQGSTANVVEVAGVTGTQGAGLENQDGLWITGNYIYSYVPTTGGGLVFDAPASGSNARRNVYVTDNQFANVAYGVNALSGLTQSVLRGNYGNTISTALFNFNNATGFTGTKLEDNTMTSEVPVYVLTNAPALVIGYNQSSAQVSGTFTWTGTGCSIAGGTVGTQCAVAVSGAIPFLDTNYKVTGCSVMGATGAVAVGNVATPTLGGAVTVYETALSTSAVSGGNVYCTVNDQ